MAETGRAMNCAEPCGAAQELGWLWKVGLWLHRPCGAAAAAVRMWSSKVCVICEKVRVAGQSSLKEVRSMR